MFFSLCHFQIHFHFTSTVEVNEMYEKYEEIAPQVAMFDHNTIRIKLSKQNCVKILLEHFFMSNTMLLFLLLYSNYENKHSKWNVLERSYP